MNEYRLSKALGGVSDELLLEATEVKKKNTTGKRWLRIAAVAAAVLVLFAVLSFWPARDDGYVTGPGMLAVRIYAAEDPAGKNFVELELTEGIQVPSENYCSASLSIMPGIPIHLSWENEAFAKENISFALYANQGEFVQIDQSFHLVIDNNCENNCTVYWRETESTIASKAEEHFVFVQIVIYQEDHVIGYSVLYFDGLTAGEYMGLNPNMHYDDPNACVGVYYASLLKSVTFPKVEGEYQDVSNDYVHECMQAIMDEKVG